MSLSSLFRRYAISPLPVPASWYAIPLRLIVGFGFIEHGYAKLARGPEGFTGIFHAIGMPFADLLGWATIIVEIVGGLLVLLGAFVPLAALPMAVVLVVAIFSVHLPNGFSPAGVRNGPFVLSRPHRALFWRRGKAVVGRRSERTPRASVTATARVSTAIIRGNRGSDSRVLPFGKSGHGPWAAVSSLRARCPAGVS